MYIPYTCHELLYTCHNLAYPVKHQPYFESIFPYFWGSLRYLDLIGSTSQTHCMVFRSLDLINHCLGSDLRIMGTDLYQGHGICEGCNLIYRVYTSMYWVHILSNTSFTLNQALSALRRRRFSAARSLLASFAATCLSNVSQHSDHPGGACHKQNSTATG